MKKVEEKVTFSVSSYKGFEDKALRLINQNRPHERTPAYMHWRYLGEKSPISPIMFWVQLEDGTPVGMAALIPRPYWINKQLHSVWVLGDISLHPRFRGKGIGEKLFRFMNSYMKEKLPGGAFVIPNQMAMKSLLAAGWSEPIPFIWLLWVLDPVSKLFPSLAKYAPFRIMGNACRLLINLWLKRYKTKNCELIEAKGFDESFDSFWRSFPKDDLIIRDRGVYSLRWRFEKHPNATYHIRKFLIDTAMEGYVVFMIESDGVCRITDFVVRESHFVKPMMILFIREQCKRKEIKVIRMKANAKHIYNEELRHIGFIARHENDVFQIYDSSNLGLFNSLNWFITIADKDT